MFQVADLGRGSWIEDLDRLPADWEREIISSAYRFHIVKFS